MINVDIQPNVDFHSEGDRYSDNLTLKKEYARTNVLKY